MIRHIVMFKLKEFATPADKQAKMQEIKTNLEALIDKIDVLRMIRVDFNVNPEDMGYYPDYRTGHFERCQHICKPSRTCCRIQRYYRPGESRQSLCGLRMLRHVKRYYYERL